MGVHLLRKQHSSASAAAASGGSSTGGGSMPPKGCMAVRVVGTVGGGAEQEEERFVVPVGYLKHPLFVGLLKEAEEEYGFRQQGAITIPCGVDNFRRVQGIIDHRQAQKHQGQGQGQGSGLISGGHHHHHNHGGSSASSGHLPFHIAACFRA